MRHSTRSKHEVENCEMIVVLSGDVARFFGLLPRRSFGGSRAATEWPE